MLASHKQVCLTGSSQWSSLTAMHGQLRTIPDGVPSNPPLLKDTALNAAQVNLGLFGVMVEVTVGVKPIVNADVKNDFTFDLSVSQINICLQLVM